MTCCGSVRIKDRGSCSRESETSQHSPRNMSETQRALRRNLPFSSSSSSLLLFCLLTSFLKAGAESETTEVFASTGSDAVLPCQSTAGPLTTVIWTKAHKGTVWRKQRSGLQYWGANWVQKGVHRAHCPHPQFIKGDYSLRLTKVELQDGGIYYCSVEVQGHKITTSVTLRVMAVSILPSVPIPGRKVSVTCNVTPWPVGASVQWMLNNQSYSPAGGSRSNNTVSQQAAPQLTGTWTCVLSFRGREGRVSADLSINGIILPPADTARVYAAVGSSVQLPCVFSPGLNPTAPLWEKLQPSTLFSKPTPDRLPLSFSTPPPSDRSPWVQTAGLTGVDFQDAGRYRCSGTVQGQSLTRTMGLIVAKIDRRSQGPHSAALTCRLSDDSDVTKYEWLRVTTEVNDSQTVQSVQEGETLSIDLLSEEMWTTWVCRYSNQDGILGNVTYQVEMTSRSTGHRPTGVSQNTVASVGLCVLLMVLLLVLAQTYKNLQRRRRILQYPALEGIVHSISVEREQRERTRVKE